MGLATTWQASDDVINLVHGLDVVTDTDVAEWHPSRQATSQNASGLNTSDGFDHGCPCLAEALAALATHAFSSWMP
jgi:hypothetical protein